MDREWRRKKRKQNPSNIFIGTDLAEARERLMETLERKGLLLEAENEDVIEQLEKERELRRKRRLFREAGKHGKQGF